MNIDINNLAVHNNKLYLKSENEFISGWNRIEVSDKEPRCKFKGGRMSIKTWFQILGFFRWTQDKYKSESQVRLYYNTKTKEWAAQPYPQSPSGMTTNDEQDEKLRSKFPTPWEYFGTAHHHCTSAAFQSGTDESNERNQDGWHYTIGNLDQAILDYHGRFSWDSELFPADLLSWVELPNWANSVPREIRYRAINEYLLCRSVSNKEEYEFPSDWKSVVKPKPVQPTYSYGSNPYNPYWEKSKGKVKQYEPLDEEISVQTAVIEDILWQSGIHITDCLSHIEGVAPLGPEDLSDLTQACRERQLTLSDFIRMVEEEYFLPD